MRTGGCIDGAIPAASCVDAPKTVGVSLVVAPVVGTGMVSEQPRRHQAGNRWSCCPCPLSLPAKGRCTALHQLQPHCAGSATGTATSSVRDCTHSGSISGTEIRHCWCNWRTTVCEGTVALSFTNNLIAMARKAVVVLQSAGAGWLWSVHDGSVGSQVTRLASSDAGWDPSILGGPRLCPDRRPRSGGPVPHATPSIPAGT
jgi:hypothetical protein